MSPAELTSLLDILLPSLIAMVAIGTAGKVITTWMRSRGGAAPKELHAISDQLKQLQHAVDTMAVEVERIEESQRFNARLLAEGRAPLEGGERRH
ncbi:MAG TPA: hypothetical protein VMM77_04135 [Gemmatimonadaceae bacterium]|nr:hypothetical protein [Gemmatimonadaceae bacterium]